MKNTRYILAIAIMAILIAAAVSTGAPGTARPEGTAIGQYPAVMFNETPVQYAQANGVDLGYRDFGSGEPLLMIEGFGATMDNWNRTFIGILASKYHVYIYDHRGMGYSADNQINAQGNAAPSISSYADDAAALMAALGYDSMNVYGVSMGSSVSQQLAIDHPERVLKLVLDSSTYSVRIPETRLLREFIESAANNSTLSEGIHEEARANLAWNGSFNGLSGIKKDVMLVVGTNDVMTPDAVSVQMAGQINGSWLVRFKGLPHVGSHYAPIEYGENALTFLGMDQSPLNRQ
ncbi:MAG: alpha/beta hydrolase [Methanothrix sp.]|nr:alpha/beta hydrolase [Methanothrix sp.]